MLSGVLLSDFSSVLLSDFSGGLLSDFSGVLLSDFSGVILSDFSGVSNVRFLWWTLVIFQAFGWSASLALIIITD